ncbi:MAG: hypothetical protein JW908_13955 [Anaerolineales bacterium]|nr:hypothetical protein [Anaerolineales bacterium]
MAQWEYHYILAFNTEIDQINDQLVQRKMHPLFEYINQCGEEGWEMVGICPASESGNYWRILFKREKSSQ